MEKNQKVEEIKMFKLFLDKPAQRKLELLRYLETKPLLIENHEKVLEELDISYFLLNKSMEELSHDFVDYGLTDEFQLFFEGNNVRLIESDRGNSTILGEMYVRHSFGFLMLQEIFFETFESVNDYAIKNYISHPLVYQKLKDMRTRLADKELTVTKKFLLSGEEGSVRGLVTFYFTKLYGRAYSVYPTEITKPVEELIRLLEPKFAASFTGFSETKLQHFLSVSLIRIKQGWRMSENKKSQLTFNKKMLETNDFFRSIFSWLEKEAKIDTEKELYSEAQQIFAYLVVEGAINEPELIEGVTLKEILALNDLFLEELGQAFILSENQLKEIRRQLTVLHLKIKYFKEENIDDNNNLDVTYFYEMYPEYFLFCRDYIKKQKKNKQIWLAKEFLFFHYVLVMMDILPIDQQLKPLRICIDFSFGPQFNALIKNNIQKISDLNIIYQTKADDETDLLLTDKEICSFGDLFQIIWLVPPRAVDWANFTNQLLKIRRNKITKMNPNN